MTAVVELSSGLQFPDLPANLPACLPPSAPDGSPSGSFVGTCSFSNKSEASFSNRSQRLHLTFIPESEYTVHHRMRIILTGRGARVLAERLVNSKVNENYRPKAIKNRADSPARSWSRLSSPDGPEPEFSLKFSTSTTNSSSQKSTHEGSLRPGEFESADRELCLFLPVGLVSGKLARIRFNIIEGFTASMPEVSEESDARDMCVALLHWQEHVTTMQQGKNLAQSAIDVSMKEFAMRTAEMNHGMKFLPLVYILCISKPVSEKDNTQFTDFVQHCQMRYRIMVVFKQVCDSREDTLMQAMQELCDDVISQRNRLLASRPSQSNDTLCIETHTNRTSCCTLS